MISPILFPGITTWILKRVGKRTEQSFFVPKDEIVENDYDLSINRYKEIEYDEVEYDEPVVIIGQIENLEEHIVRGIGELKLMI